MKRQRGRFAIILAGVLIAATLAGSDAQAGINEKNWEVGGYVVNSRFANSSGISDVFTLGARGAYFMKPAHGVEVDFDSGSANGRAVPSLTFDVRKIGLSYIHNKTLKAKEKVLPVILVGMGKIHVDNGTDAATRTYIQGGAGFRYFYTPRLAFRLDGRIYRWRGRPPVTSASPYFSFDLTIGLSYLLGAVK